MRPRKQEATREGDLFRARLEQIINMKHEPVQLAGKVDWTWIHEEKGRPCCCCSSTCSDCPTGHGSKASGGRQPKQETAQDE